MDSELSRQNQKNVLKRFDELKVPMSSNGQQLPYRVSVTGDLITLTLQCSIGDVDRLCTISPTCTKRPRSAQKGI
jgi:hypothetical protein